MQLRSLVLSCAALAFACGARADEAPAPANPAPTATPAPATISADVKVGDEWDYKVVSKIEGQGSAVESYVVQEVGKDRIEGELHTHRMSGDRDARVVIAFDRYWRVQEGPRGQMVQSDAREVPFPAATVGKEWTAVTYWQPRYSSLRFKWTEHGAIVAWETVKLSDGKSYDALKIVYRRESLPGEGTGIRLVQAGTLSNKTVERDVQWYAPSVNRFVKRTYELSSDDAVKQSFTEELTSYKRGD